MVFLYYSEHCSLPLFLCSCSLPLAVQHLTILCALLICLCVFVFVCLSLSLSQVSWAEQQVVKRRKKRDVFTEPSDPKFRDQWYLVSINQSGQKNHLTKACVSGEWVQIPLEFIQHCTLIAIPIHPKSIHVIKFGPVMPTPCQKADKACTNRCSLCGCLVCTTSTNKNDFHLQLSAFKILYSHTVP